MPPKLNPLVAFAAPALDLVVPLRLDPKSTLEPVDAIVKYSISLTLEDPLNPPTEKTRVDEANAAPSLLFADKFP